MAKNNRSNGAAFEYACLKAFQEFLESNRRTVIVDYNSKPLKSAMKSFNNLGEDKRNMYDRAARTSVGIIVPLEPQFTYGEGEFELSINEDSVAMGPYGDVRDVMCRKTKPGSKTWEIGFSCKHNHMAIKHPRITEKKDFGTAWIGYPCSKEYIDTVGTIMKPLEEYERRGIPWNKVNDVHGNYFEPILDAMTDELVSICKAYPDAPKRLFSYFIGSQDYYKIIDNESQKSTHVQAFNMSKSLGKKCERHRPVASIPQIYSPNRLIEVRRYIERNGNKSTTTIILTFDEGWVISIRLHNRDGPVKQTALGFDAQLVAAPTKFFNQMAPWVSE